MDVSAKVNTNVDELFDKIGKDCIKMFEENVK